MMDDPSFISNKKKHDIKFNSNKTKIEMDSSIA